MLIETEMNIFHENNLPDDNNWKVIVRLSEQFVEWITLDEQRLLLQGKRQIIWTYILER